MVQYNYKNGMMYFEFHSQGSCLTCFSLPELQKQTQIIFGINILTLLN